MDGYNYVGFFLPLTEKPLVNQKDLLSEFIGSFAGLSWQYDTTDDNYTTVFIEQCNITGECVQHDVTNNTQHILVVSVLDGNMFYLVIYQDGLEAFRSESFTEIGRGSGYGNFGVLFIIK